MPDQIRKLLDFIVAHYVVRDEQVDIDLNATAAESGSEIESEKRDVAQRESERAVELAGAFHQGLVAAARARAAGQAEIALDDRVPDEDRMADALIGFLVSYELATSRTDETEPLHYVYYVAVDWKRLAEVARAAEVDLDRALA